MRARTLALAFAVVVLGATAPADALAHNLSRPSPVFGDGGSVFTFQGRAWQPRGTIQAQYFRRDTDSRPFRTGQFRTGRNGAFTFRLSNPWFWDTGRLERMCFAQFDTRFGRTFRKCQSFYVAPASAYFMPADGLGGQLFILVANGFEPGVTLTIELTTPTGELQRYEMTTRTRSGLVQGGEFGPIFVPRGGAFRRFQSNPTDPKGLYTAFVFEPNAPARARAAVLVR